jgi:hypothetical protein
MTPLSTLTAIYNGDCRQRTTDHHDARSVGWCIENVAALAMPSCNRAAEQAHAGTRSSSTQSAQAFQACNLVFHFPTRPIATDQSGSQLFHAVLVQQSMGGLLAAMPGISC